MRDVIGNRIFAWVAPLVLLATFAGCTDPWIVQGGVDLHDKRRPTAFVEGNTPLASWIGTNFGWQSVHPAPWHSTVHPAHPEAHPAHSEAQLAQPTEKETTKPDKTTRKKKKTWILRKPSEALAGGKGPAKQPDCNRQPSARSEGSGSRRNVR